MERTNEQWIADLSYPGQPQEAALSDLRKIIMAGLPYALTKWLSPTEPQFESLIEESTQDTLLRVLDKLSTFEGRSKFTTWVYKIAVRIALTELRRRRWRDVSLDQLIEKPNVPETPIFTADDSPSPENIVEQSDLIDQVKRVISENLTEKQSKALVAIAIHGMPIEEVAIRLNTSRNALYKLLHDARVRLKKELAQEGISPEDLLALFDRE